MRGSRRMVARRSTSAGAAGAQRGAAAWRGGPGAVDRAQPFGERGAQARVDARRAERRRGQVETVDRRRRGCSSAARAAAPRGVEPSITSQSGARAGARAEAEQGAPARQVGSDEVIRTRARPRGGAGLGRRGLVETRQRIGVGVDRHHQREAGVGAGGGRGGERARPGALADESEARRIDAGAFDERPPRELDVGELDLALAAIGERAEAPAEAVGAPRSQPQHRDAALGEELEERHELVPARRTGVGLEPEHSRAPWLRRQVAARAARPPELRRQAAVRARQRERLGIHQVLGIDRRREPVGERLRHAVGAPPPEIPRPARARDHPERGGARPLGQERHRPRAGRRLGQRPLGAAHEVEPAQLAAPGAGELERDRPVAADAGVERRAAVAAERRPGTRGEVEPLRPRQVGGVVGDQQQPLAIAREGERARTCPPRRRAAAAGSRPRLDRAGRARANGRRSRAPARRAGRPRRSRRAPARAPRARWRGVPRRRRARAGARDHRRPEAPRRTGRRGPRRRRATASSRPAAARARGAPPRGRTGPRSSRRRPRWRRPRSGGGRRRASRAHARRRSRRGAPARSAPARVRSGRRMCPRRRPGSRERGPGRCARRARRRRSRRRRRACRGGAPARVVARGPTPVPSRRWPRGRPSP